MSEYRHITTIQLLRVRKSREGNSLFIFGKTNQGKVVTFITSGIDQDDDYQRLLRASECRVGFKTYNPVKPQKGQYKHSPEFIEADYFLKGAEILWGDLVDRRTGEQI